MELVDISRHVCHAILLCFGLHIQTQAVDQVEIQSPDSCSEISISQAIRLEYLSSVVDALYKKIYLLEVENGPWASIEISNIDIFLHGYQNIEIAKAIKKRFGINLPEIPCETESDLLAQYFNNLAMTCETEAESVLTYDFTTQRTIAYRMNESGVGINGIPNTPPTQEQLRLYHDLKLYREYQDAIRYLNFQILALMVNELDYQIEADNTELLTKLGVFENSSFMNLIRQYGYIDHAQ